jgi:group I intron endonuclease
LRKHRHVNRHLQSSYDLYGDAFVFIILEDVSDEKDLLTRERYYIDLLKPQYNIALFAGSPTRGRKMTYEAIARRTATVRARREQDPSYGVRIVSEEEKERFRTMYTGKKLPPRSPEWIERNVAASRGRPLTGEHKQKLRVPKQKKQSPEYIEKRVSKTRGKKQFPELIAKRASALRGKKMTPEHMAKATEAGRLANTGKPRSLDVRAKISATQRGSKQSPETKAKRKATWEAKRLAKQQANQLPLF